MLHNPNDSMGPYVATEVVKLMIKRGTPVKGAKLVTRDIRELSETNVAGGINPGLTSGVLMLGITFKENCPDIRNTKAIDIYPMKRPCHRINFKGDDTKRKQK